MAHSSEVREKIRGFGTVGDEERAARFSVWRVRGIGYGRMARLIDETDADIAGLFSSSSARVAQSLERAQLSKKVHERLESKISTSDPVAELAEELDKVAPGTSIHHLGEPGYPGRLLDLADPPVFVYVRGEMHWLDHLTTVAIVGSRKASVRDARLARTVAQELADAGICVISGGALGIDASAHRGCLDAGMPTIAVLAGGVDRPTPRKNASIFEETITRGALVSEYPTGVEPRRFHFQRRNSLIAALGDATVVVRAGEKSGTLITARAAAEIDRPLCAFPGPLDEALTAGCHKLLVEGAQCVRGAADILEHVLGRCPAPTRVEQPSLLPDDCAGAAPPSKRPSPPPVELDISDGAKEVLEALREVAEETGTDAVHVDPLKRRLDLEERRVDALLLELELAGAVAKKPGANAFVV